MARIIALPDLHITDPGPATRLDDVLVSQMSLLSWLHDTYKPDGYVAPGDIGDKRRWPNSAAIMFARWLSDVGVPVVADLGQHDLQGHDLTTFNDSSDLAILAAASANLHVLDEGEVLKIKNTTVACVHWGSKTWQKILDADYEMEAEIVTCHAPVTTGDFPGSINPRTLEIEGEGYLVFGDIHKGFKPLKLPANKSITAMAGGVLTPMKRNEAEFDCSAYLIDTTKKKVERIPLWDGVEWEFTDEGSELQDDSYSSEAFLNSLEASIEAIGDGEDTRDYVKTVARKTKAPKHALDLILSELNNG